MIRRAPALALGLGEHVLEELSRVCHQEEVAVHRATVLGTPAIDLDEGLGRLVAPAVSARRRREPHPLEVGDRVALDHFAELEAADDQRRDLVGVFGRDLGDLDHDEVALEVDLRGLVERGAVEPGRRLERDAQSTVARQAVAGAAEHDEREAGQRLHDERERHEQRAERAGSCYQPARSGWLGRFTYVCAGAKVSASATSK